MEKPKTRGQSSAGFFPRAYVGITRGLPSIVVVDQNNNVVGPSDYFKLIINDKYSIRKINLGLSINEVIEEVLDVPAAITKASCHGIDTKEGNEVEPSVTFEVLKSRPVKTRNAKQTKKKK